MEPSTKNDFFIGTDGTKLAAVLPVAITTREQAYRTAAWIELMGITLPREEQENTYEEVREAIRNT